MIIGMWTTPQLRERLAAIEVSLERDDREPFLSDHQRGELEDAHAELSCHLMDLWRIEGGGVREP